MPDVSCHGDTVDVKALKSAAMPDVSRRGTAVAVKVLKSAAMTGVFSRGAAVDVNALKSTSCHKYALARAPKLFKMIAAVPEADRGALLPRLRVKTLRTASGVVVVAVMSKPHRCPHIATTENICVY